MRYWIVCGMVSALAACGPPAGRFSCGDKTCAKGTEICAETPSDLLFGKGEGEEKESGE